MNLEDSNTIVTAVGTVKKLAIGMNTDFGGGILSE